MGDYHYSSIVQPLASLKVVADSDNRRVVCNGSRTITQKRRRRPICLMIRKMKGKQKQQVVNKTTCPQTNEVESTNTSLSKKYQPKLFQDIVGQNIVVKTLSNAVQKKKVAPLYLFHGPNGTGKTSAARIFAMALNCESNIHDKPCCNCKGCSRSLYTMELCSGNRISGFEKIRTLLQNTSFAQAITGLKVFIIEECHSLSLEAWDELMSLLEGPYGSNLVFLLIMVDVNSATGNIASRCQKFYFTKLNDEDIMKKLSTILFHERMEIEKEALKLIVAKSDGSLRDAENILDQLALLGPTITTSMTQELVGLIPQNKLLDLLAVAVSGDTINTIRQAKKLSESVEPISFVSQLVNLITNVLSGNAVLDSSSADTSRSQLSKTHSARMCYILKLLVETEKQLRSSEQTSNILAAFLDITSVKTSNRNSTNIVLPRGQRSSSFSEKTLHSGEPVESIDEHKRHHVRRGSLSDMEELWQDVLKGIESSYTQNFLHDQAKLALLSISKTNAIVHLTFTRPTDKMAAEISEESLAKALAAAIGCPVTLHLSLEEPQTSGQNSKSTISSGSHKLYSQQQSTTSQFDPNRNEKSSAVAEAEGLRLTKSKSCSTSQRPNRYLSKGRESNTVQLPNLTHMFDNPTSDTKDPQRANLIQAENSKHVTQSMRVNKGKHRWLSLSSIPQSDASVEPYSQDVMYANFNKIEDDTVVRKIPKFQKALSKSSKDRRFREPADRLQSNPAWCC